MDGHYFDLQNASDSILEQTCFAGQGGGYSWWEVDIGFLCNVLDVYYYGRNIAILCKCANTKSFLPTKILLNGILILQN